MSKPISTIDFVSSYITKLKLEKPKELAELFGQQVKCHKCSAIIIAKDSWLVLRNGDLICPVCGDVWVRMVKR